MAEDGRKDLTKFVVGRGNKQTVYDLTLIPDFVVGDSTWMTDIIEKHKEYTEKDLQQTLILNKQEANMLRGVRAKERKDGEKKHPGGGLYMMLCVLTGAKLRDPIPSGRTEDIYPGFTSWDHLKTMQAQWKDNARKQRERMGVVRSARPGKGNDAGGKPRKPGERRADHRTPVTPSTGVMDVKGGAQAQFRNSSNPYAI